MTVPDTSTSAASAGLHDAAGADRVDADDGADQRQLALFIRVRDWMWHQNASSWVADAFGHWVIAEIAPHEPVPERLSDLWVRWNYGDVPRLYRARHAARLSGSAPWAPGEALPAPRAPWI